MTYPPASTISTPPSYYSRCYVIGLMLLVSALLLALAATLHWYTTLTPGHTPHNYYALLGDAFLSGQTYLKIKPSAWLLSLPDPYEPSAHRKLCLWDASLYQGKYYLYFGPVPGLVWAAAKLFTGVSLGDSQLALGFSVAGTSCLSLLLLLIALRNRMASYAGLFLALVSLGLGTWLPFMLRRASFYEAAIAGAYCFSALGFLLLWQGFSCRENKRIYWLSLASLSFGLATGCRLPHVFNGGVLAIAWLAMRRTPDAPSPLIAFLCLFMPWCLCLAGLGEYNYVRFGSFFETGFHHQLTLNNYHKPFHALQWHKIIPNAYYYLLRPLPFRTPFTFPFFHITYFESIILPGNIVAQTPEPVYGLLPNSPFALWILAAPYCRALTRETRMITASVAVYGVALLCLLLVYFFTTARYALDFAPWLMFLAAIQYLRLLSMAKTRWAITMLMIAGAATALYGAFAGGMSGYCGEFLCANL